MRDLLDLLGFQKGLREVSGRVTLNSIRSQPMLPRYAALRACCAILRFEPVAVALIGTDSTCSPRWLEPFSGSRTQPS